MSQDAEQQHDKELEEQPAAASESTQGLLPPGGDGAALDPAAEQDLWTGRTSWKHFTDSLAIVGASTVVAILISFSVPPWLRYVLLILILLSWAFVLGKIAYTALSLKYRLTTQRLFIERGILGKTIDQTELIRVDDVRVTKTFFDRLMGLGTVQIMSTDMSDQQVVIVGIQEPEKIADQVRQHMRTLRRKSLFVENL